MSPQPSQPDRGRPEQGEVELEAAESAQAEGQEAAAEQAEAPKPKRKRAARKKPKQAEGTAAEATGVDKDVAEAGEGTETEEPAVEPQPEEAVVERAEEPDEEPAQAPAAQATVERSPRAARRRRDRRPSPVAADGAEVAVQVRAHARFVRSSARKARLVSDHIRGKSVEDARAILAHAQRNVARDWAKLLESAVANAEHNHELLEDDLRIHAAFADEGPTLKRFQPRAQGRATRIRKRTSHLTITLTPKATHRRNH
jgi:ribosomal protein L22